MSLTTFRSWIYGELVTVSMMNQQIRDNGNAIWVGTTAGDMDYYTGATGKARLPIGTAGQILKVNAGATAPEWKTGTGLSCYASFTGGSVAGGTQTTWTDIALATVNIVVPHTVTLFAIAVGLATMSSVGNGEIRWMLDTTGQIGANTGSANVPISDTFTILGVKTGVTAGTKTCKLQYQVSSGDTLGVSSIAGFVLGFAE
jgi:hypothetical protein